MKRKIKSFFDHFILSVMARHTVIERRTESLYVLYYTEAMDT